jgi:hypothetical protein
MESERLFADYLSANGWEFEYEHEFGGKRPDFALKAPAGEFDAVVEVEDLMLSKAEALRRKADSEARLLGVPVPARRVNPYKHVRQAINDATKQFRGTKNLPSMVVLYDRAFRADLTNPMVVFGAMFGDDSMVLKVDRAEGFTEQSMAFARGGKMVYEGRIQCTRISAVAVLQSVRVEEHTSGFKAALDARAGEARDLEGAVIPRPSRLIEAVEVSA